MRLDPAIDEIPSALSNAEKCRRHRRKKKAPVQIAILDMETDPFDNVGKTAVYPFLAVLHRNDAAPLVLWDENYPRLMQQVRDAILALPGRFIIYAHNGGRFDFLLLLRELRGEVLFKGRSLMSAQIGPHELRDSFHIIPESLKNANRKTEIDYSYFTRARRGKHKQEIIDYCIDDCESLYEIVSTFRDQFGTPLTIGQAAMREIKKSGIVVENLTEGADAFFRNWFFGGRVECLKKGIFDPTDLGLFDVNSMYPYTMANYLHPSSSSFTVSDCLSDDTAFLTIRCRNNGALVSRAPDGSLTTRQKEGIFNTTIYEFNVARKHGLIRDIEILQCIKFERYTHFKAFVEPLYEARQLAKKRIQHAKANGDHFALRLAEKDSLFYKLLLNNGYGKFAQNPRRFKTHYITDPMERPADDEAYGDLPLIEADGYWIWCKDSDCHRYNNVATAASITGASRGVLLDALASCRNPVYCDTDSIICTALDDKQLIDPIALGAWDREAQISAFIGNGKKLYAYKCPDNRTVVKAKGMNGVSWDDMVALANGKILHKTMKAPTIGKDGIQHYLTRELRATI